MPTLDDLAARVTRLEQHLGLDEPAPAPQPPAKPTGLTCVIGPDGRPVLDWDDDPTVDEWDVRDELNLSRPVQATVAAPHSVRSPLKPGARRRYTVLARNRFGESPQSEPVDVPATAGGSTPESTPAPGPSAGVDLARWKLTIPERDANGKVVEIKPPALATYSSRYFTRLDGGAVRLRVWHGGQTTANSPNPRSELRERVGGLPEGYWDATKGWHTLIVEGQVDRLTKVRPHLVLAQIHGGGDDVTVFRVEGAKLWITDGDNNHGFLIDDAFTLGRRYTLGLDVEDGHIAYQYNGRPVPFTLRTSDTSCYFKAGAYLQSNPASAPDESPDEYAEVVVYSATVTHGS